MAERYATAVDSFRAASLCVSIIALAGSVAAQNVAINTVGTPPRDPALLDITSSDKGILLPRVPLVARNVAAPVAAPADALLLYNTSKVVFAGNSAQYDINPGFYTWDAANQRWLSLPALVRRPEVIKSSVSFTTSGSAWCTSSSPKARLKSKIFSSR